MGFSRLAETTAPAARIGLGLAAVGRPAYITLGRDRDLPADRTVEAMRQRSQELLDTAYVHGVRYLDAARSYGRAEEFLADWLAGHPEVRDVVVGSKWGYTYVADWRTDAPTHEVKDHSAGAYERQRGLTDALLGDRLDVYQIHSLTPDSPALTDRALHERLAALAAEGVTIGVSTSGPHQADAIRAALGVEAGGAPLFRTFQTTYNLLEPSAGAALVEARDAGRSVIVKEAVANGRLAAPEAAPPAVRQVAEETGSTPDAVALAAVLHRPWANVVLSGAATVPQLRSNLAAATLRLNERQLALLDGLVEEPEAYWRHRAELPWA
ncbi:aldo/keto reductase [Streptomyces sp. NA02950]|uniref:aldo/keto reductase n=1 Tax=Streptomyces sp. NA02950 TaxID=2742137 RepID=UPI0015923B10|nr:aldo/keto reductase [Streptomyces sp. NA02950]QKV91677.1 aldo/keto reductase [Streptomyces sp. NA02950]